MRLRDDNKVEAIYEATIRLVNEIGFAEASVSKIAKRAKVSAATIYIYFANKEDMLGKTYLKAKRLMSERVFRNMPAEASVRERFEAFTRNFVDFIVNNGDVYLFMEQVSNSPLLQNWCLEDTGPLYAPLYELFEDGKREGLFKQEDLQLLITFTALPIAELAKSHLKGESVLDDARMAKAIQISWDAVKV